MYFLVTYHCRCKATVISRPPKFLFPKILESKPSHAHKWPTQVLLWIFRDPPPGQGFGRVRADSQVCKANR